MTWGPLPDPAKDYRAHLALQARKMNFWIYSKTTKTWYTPEEFIWSKEDINVHRGKANAPQLILMDPREGLKKANDLILRASKFVEAHTKKINQYYDLKKK